MLHLHRDRLAMFLLDGSRRHELYKEMKYTKCLPRNSSRIFDILALFFALSFGFESESKDALFVRLCHCRPFEK